MEQAGHFRSIQHSAADQIPLCGSRLGQREWLVPVCSAGCSQEGIALQWRACRGGQEVRGSQRCKGETTAHWEKGNPVALGGCYPVQERKSSNKSAKIVSPISDLLQPMYILLSMSSLLVYSSQSISIPSTTHIMKDHVSSQGGISLIPKSFGGSSPH